MRLLAIVPHLYDTVPGQRFRFEQWEPFLKHEGITVTFVPFEDKRLHHIVHQRGNANLKIRLTLRAFARRLRLLRSVRQYDAVLVYREVAPFGPPLLEQKIHDSGVPMLFDFDDAIFFPPAGSANKYANWLRKPSKIRTICRLASHVIAGNQYLADYAREVNDQVSIVPTTIDMKAYQRDSSVAAADPVAVGWSGSFSTVQYLDDLRPALQRLSQKEKFQLRVIGTPNYSLEGVQTEARAWRSASEVTDLQRLDIGVMPLPDNKWARGKCGLKALQYMALSIPTIVSPVGVNSKIICDGENGFLANSEDEWIEKLTQLVRSPDLRRRIGEAGRKTVEEEYSATKQAPRVLEILRSVV